VRKLGTATAESISRLQSSLQTAFPYALGMFEPSPYEEDLIKEGLYAGENRTRAAWLENIQKVLNQTALSLPDIGQVEPVLGGRRGHHTAHLTALLEELSEVVRIDPTAEW
jgi:ring-1,2-phenylacetyl-CoA epoxidase subunit PaaC